MQHIDWPFFDKPHRDLAAAVRSWAGSHLAAEAEPTDVDAACRTLLGQLGAAGWLRYCVKAEHGGALPELDARAICLLRETFAYHSGLADFVFAMQGLGSGAISLYGNAAQQGRYLPRVARGEAMAAFALSEPGSGSDVGALTTRAERCGDYYVLNGAKTWISNGGIADFYVVFARSGEAPGTRGLSAFIVDVDTPGLNVARRIEVIAPHPLATLSFENCRVPATNLIGVAGQGFKVAMQTLDVFRTSVAAAAFGFARRAYDEAIAHAASRRLFGQALAEFQMTQGKFADMATALDASALLVYRAAWQRDRGERVTREAAMAKMFSTENAQAVIDAALQMFGGRGVVKGEIIESLYRSIRALRIYEGATEVQKLVIAREELNSLSRASVAPNK